MLGTNPRLQVFGFSRLEITELFWVQYSGVLAGTSDIFLKMGGSRMIKTRNNEVLLYYNSVMVE